MDGKRKGVRAPEQADHIPERGGYSDDQYSDRADMSRVNRVVPALFLSENLPKNACYKWIMRLRQIR